MNSHIAKAALILESHKAREIQKVQDARELYERCLCDEEMDGDVAKRLVAAAELLGITHEQMVIDASIADSMRKIEQRRYALGIRMLRITKRCLEVESRLNAGYSTMPGIDFERLREFGLAIGDEEVRLKEYRAWLEEDVRTLARRSKVFHNQWTRLEIPLPAMEDVEPCDAKTFTAGFDPALGIDWPPPEDIPAWEELVA